MVRAELWPLRDQFLGNHSLPSSSGESVHDGVSPAIVSAGTETSFAASSAMDQAARQLILPIFIAFVHRVMGRNAGNAPFSEPSSTPSENETKKDPVGRETWAERREREVKGMLTHCKRDALLML